MSKKLLKRQKHNVLGLSLGFGVLALLGGGSHPLGFFSLSFQSSLDPFWSPLTKPSPWSRSTLLTLPPATLSFFPLNRLISLETLPRKNIYIYVSSKMFSDKILVSLASEHHLGPLQGERQLLTGAVSARCCAGVKPNLPPGGKSHYSKELSEKAGHELQTPSEETDGKRGAWCGVKPEPRSHCMAQQTPKTKASKIKKPLAL